MNDYSIDEFTFPKVSLSFKADHLVEVTLGGGGNQRRLAVALTIRYGDSRRGPLEDGHSFQRVWVDKEHGTVIVLNANPNQGVTILTYMPLPVSDGL